MPEIENLEEEPLQDEAPAERTQGAPIESRFLFVDVAALRAKQLRRGARPRLSELTEESEAPEVKSYKAERVAMDEVRSSLVEWQLPEFKVVVDNR